MTNPNPNESSPLLNKALEEGYLDPIKAEQIRQQAQKTNISIEEALLESKSLSPGEFDSLITIVKTEKQKVDEKTELKVEDFLFGDLVIQAGYATAEQIQEAVEYQKNYTAQGVHYRMGDILIEMGILSKEQLRELLSEQNKIILRCNPCQIQFNVLQKALDYGPKCPRCGNAVEELSELEAVSVVATLAGPANLAPPQAENLEALGSWKILKKLGQGGMGAVYLGEDKEGRQAAIKVIPPEIASHPEMKARFLREAKAASKVQNKHIVQVYDYGEFEGKPYIAMEFVPGGSLLDLVKKGVLSVDRGIAILVDSLRGLEAAHNAGVIHRDLKPDNIMLAADGTAKLADFGLARREQESIFVTQPGDIMGTPCYMSPEQCKGESTDHRTDIYAMGVTAYVMFTGKLPFAGKTPFEIISKTLMEAPQPFESQAQDLPESLKTPLGKIISKMMAKGLEQRYQRVGEVLGDLFHLQEETKLEALGKALGEPTRAKEKELKHSDPLIGKKMSACKIVRKLGQGGMGAVYEAINEALARKVAIKVLAPHLSQDEGLRERFIREARAAAKLIAPQIVQVFSVGESNGVHYIEMEFVEGDSLKDRIDKGMIPFEESLRIFKEVVKGLQMAHSKGIVHRDLKPDNIMIDKEGQPKLADFGLAQVADSQRLTQTGAMMGTPTYIAPEQAQSQPVDGRSDLYSLGATFYHVFTGSIPYKGESSMAVMFKHVNEAFPDPLKIKPDLNPRIAQILGKMMEKKPENRYQSAKELLEDLENLSPGTRISSSPSGKKKGSPALVGGIIIGVVLLAVFFIFSQKNQNPSSSTTTSKNPEQNNPSSTQKNPSTSGSGSESGSSGTPVETVEKKKPLKELVELVRKHLQGENFKEARVSHAQIEKSYPDSPEATRLKVEIEDQYRKKQLNNELAAAQKLTQAKEWKLAKESIRRAMSIDPKSEEAQRFLKEIQQKEEHDSTVAEASRDLQEATLAFQGENWKHALEIYKKLKKSLVQNPWLGEEINQIREIPQKEAIANFQMGYQSAKEQKLEKKLELAKDSYERLLVQLKGPYFTESFQKEKTLEVTEELRIVSKELYQSWMEKAGSQYSQKNYEGTFYEAEKAWKLKNYITPSEYHQAYRLYCDARNFNELPPGYAYIPRDFCDVGKEKKRTWVAPFYLCQKEVTNKEYREFLRSSEYEKNLQKVLGKGYDEVKEKLVDGTGKAGPKYWNDGTFREGEENLPVEGICWYEAKGYALYKKGRLPTSQEWEKSAGWNPVKKERWEYPWGQDFNMQFAVLQRESPLPGGSISQDKSYYGCYDLAGNVYEWCVGTENGMEVALRHGGSYKGYNSEEEAKTWAGKILYHPSQDPLSKGANQRLKGLGLRIAQSVKYSYNGHQ